MSIHKILKPVATAALGTSLLAAGSLTACKTSDYLDVTSPSRIAAAGLESPSNAALLVNGAVADFECAYGSYVTATGLISDELDDATQTAARYPYDQRTLLSSSSTYQSNDCVGLGTYSPLQTARVSSDNIRRLLTQWTDAQVPDRQTLLATAAAYEGYADLLLGEGFCSTVFTSYNADGTPNYGTEITPKQAFDSAITRFSDAITAAQAAGTGAQNYLYMAYVGRARAKLDEGDLAGARADAILVPSTFVLNMTASNISSRRYNRVWADNGQSGAAYNQASSVAATFRGLNDPRVPVVHPNVPNSTTGVPIWIQLKYSSATSPIPIASGVEAQLIVAEADLATNPTEALTIINASRAAGNESALSSSTTASDLKDALIEERRRALFLQGERLYDIIRYQLPLNPAAGTKYQPNVGTYGSQVCMPLPDVERFNNPLLKT